METHYPAVTCITPSTGDRHDMLKRCISQFLSQDYKGEKHLCIADTGMIECLMDIPKNIWHWESDKATIGAKRNELCRLAKTDIILSWDNDDFYSDSWITRSIAALGDNDMTGLRHGYFYNTATGIGKYYQTNTPQPYVLGATMCYRKRIWEANPFPDNVQFGEDTAFMAHAGRVVNHDYVDGFTAIIHGNNTCSHRAFQTMKVVDRNIIPYVKRYA